MEFHRKNYRQLVGYDRYAKVLNRVKESLSQLTGVTDSKRIDDALWDINPTISYNIEEGVGVLLPSNAAGLLMLELKHQWEAAEDIGASRVQAQQSETVEPIQIHIGKLIDRVEIITHSGSCNNQPPEPLYRLHPSPEIKVAEKLLTLLQNLDKELREQV